jgi:hypothetical protein
MPDLALVTAGQLRVEESLEQDTLPAGVAIAAGQSVKKDATTGRWILGDASAAATANAYGMAVRTVPPGMAVTAVRRGLVEGFDLDALDYGDTVFLSDTAGAVADAAGTVTKQVGEVTPVHSHLLGGTPDKLLRLDYAGAETEAV